MLLRSGKDLGDDPDKRLDFQSCSIQQGGFIRSGGLRHPSRFQQVNKCSYENLARINELGFITVDSVDANNSRPDDQFVQHSVHSTITVFMQPNKLSQFKQTFLEFMPSVCFIHHIILDEELKNDDFKRFQMPVDYFYFGERSGRQANVRLYFSEKDLDWFRKQVHLKPNEPVEFITLVDMRGKYKANEEKGLFTKLQECLSSLTTV